MINFIIFLIICFLYIFLATLTFKIVILLAENKLFFDADVRDITVYSPIAYILSVFFPLSVPILSGVYAIKYFVIYSNYLIDLIIKKIKEYYL